MLEKHTAKIRWYEVIYFFNVFVCVTAIDNEGYNLKIRNLQKPLILNRKHKTICKYIPLRMTVKEPKPLSSPPIRLDSKADKKT